MSTRQTFALLLVAALLAVGLRGAWVWRQLDLERARHREQLARFAATVLTADPRGSAAALATLERARRGNELLHASLWLYDDAGALIGASLERQSGPAEPRLWRPPTAAEYSGWHALPNDTGALALAGGETLVVHTPPIPSLRRWWKVLLQPLLFVVGVATLVGTLVLGYLRRKADEAKSVMARLATGELGARFAIHREDEIGQLMATFNRMAGEIERLVGEARRADGARQRLLAELGHDLRTPLTALTNAVETLERHPELAAAARQRCARIALREAHHVHGLVENLLLLSRTDAPDHALRQQPVDLHALLQDEIESVRELRPELCFELALAAATTVGEPDLLRRALRNLLDNAVQHANSRVTISLRQASASIEVCLGDDGPGLPSWLLRGEEAPADAGSRRGLGLAIVRRVLALHEGRLVCANAEGGGAQLRLCLRAAGAI